MPNKKDTRVNVEVNFSKETLFKGMLIAHEMDITFNQLVEYCLKKAIEKSKNGKKHSRAFPETKDSN